MDTRRLVHRSAEQFEKKLSISSGYIVKASVVFILVFEFLSGVTDNDLAKFLQGLSQYSNNFCLENVMYFAIKCASNNFN